MKNCLIVTLSYCKKAPFKKYTLLTICQFNSLPFRIHAFPIFSFNPFLILSFYHLSILSFNH